MTTQPRGRSEYVPPVRPRSARQDGLRRYTPGYLEDLSDTQALFFNDPGGKAARQTLVSPSRGRRVRLINLTVTQTTADGVHFCEVYFGEGATISAHTSRAVAIVRVPDNGVGSTRTWGRGAGPVGKRNEPLSIRWTGAPNASHKIIVEYTEER